MWRKVLAGLAAAVTAVPAQATWLEARTPHFVIYSEQKSAALTRYAEQLERFDQAVRPFFHTDDPELSDARKLRIYVLRDQTAVGTLAGDAMIAGLYVTRASGSRAWVHRSDSGSALELNAQTVFQHEYLHHLVLGRTGAPLPMWVSEGMAEFFGTAQVRPDGSVMIGYVPRYRARDLFQDQLPLEQMLAPARDRMTSQDVLQTYARGWLLIHYLSFNKARGGQLNRYLALIAQGKPQLESAREAFGDLRKLNRELSGYLRQNSYTGRVVPADKINPGTVSIRPLGAGEAAIMPVQMRSERGVNNRTAPAVLQNALRVAARFPNDPAVLAALAEAQQDAGDNAAAIASADRALAADPKSQKALVMKSRALMALAAKEPKKTDFRALRQVIAAANRIDPDNAEPLLMFYQTYDLQGIKPTKNSVDGLYYALDLVPQDDAIRLVAVHQLVVDNNLPAAARAFGPIAYNPHASKMAPKLQAVMASLQSGSQDAALRSLESLGKEDAPAQAGSGR